MRTNPIITEISGKKQFVIFIDYHDGKPHSVVTCDPDLKVYTTWDFDLNLNWDEYMHYNSGGGAFNKIISGPQYAKGVKGASVWIAKCVKFDKKYPPKNCRILKAPLRLKKDGKTMIDPFKFSYQEVMDIMYCKFCNGYYNESGCNEHMDLWNDVYNDGSPLDE